ncbi:putative Hydrolase [Seiridium cardinale]
MPIGALNLHKSCYSRHAGDTAADNEGPHPLYHEDEVWLSYSGSCKYSAVTSQFFRSAIPCNSLANLVSKLVSGQDNGVYGTGHNCFFKSPDGKETWNGFQATINSEGSCGGDRFTLAQIVNFDGGYEPRLGIPFPLNATLRAPSGEQGLIRESWRNHIP